MRRRVSCRESSCGLFTHRKLARCQTVIVGKQFLQDNRRGESRVHIPVDFYSANLLAGILDCLAGGALKRRTLEAEVTSGAEQCALGRCDTQVDGLLAYRSRVVLRYGKCHFKLLGLGDILSLSCRFS